MARSLARGERWPVGPVAGSFRDAGRILRGTVSGRFSTTQGAWFGAEAKNQAQKKTSPGRRSLPVVEGSPSIPARVL